MNHTISGSPAQADERVDGQRSFFDALIMVINVGISNASAECRMNYERFFGFRC